MDDGGRDDRRGSGPKTIGKVIRGDSPLGTPQFDKPVLRPPQRQNLLNAEEFEAKQGAKQILDEAHAKAREIVAEGERQKEEIFARARAEAQADVVAKTSEEIARAKVQVGQILAESESEVVKLALKLAEKIIGRDLERDPAVILEICATATESARQAKAMVLRVNPQDSKTLREKRPKLMELIGRSLELAIRDDSDVEPGGCIIQTEFGTIDAQLKTQFGMLKNLLLPDAGKRENP